MEYAVDRIECIESSIRSTIVQNRPIRSIRYDTYRMDRAQSTRAIQIPINFLRIVATVTLSAFKEGCATLHQDSTVFMQCFLAGSTLVFAYYWLVLGVPPRSAGTNGCKMLPPWGLLSTPKVRAYMYYKHMLSGWGRREETEKTGKVAKLHRIGPYKMYGHSITLPVFSFQWKLYSQPLFNGCRHMSRLIVGAPLRC